MCPRLRTSGGGLFLALRLFLRAAVHNVLILGEDVIESVEFIFVRASTSREVYCPLEH